MAGYRASATAGVHSPAYSAAVHIVGIGASAAGMAALETFFQQVPQQTGLCFVVVQHLSSTFKNDG